MPGARYHAWCSDEALRAYCRTDETRSGHLYLSSFWVAPDCRGTGTSAKFLTSVLADAKVRGYDRVLLKVHEDNVAAQRLYTGAGFVAQQKWNKRFEMELR